MGDSPEDESKGNEKLEVCVEDVQSHIKTTKKKKKNQKRKEKRQNNKEEKRQNIKDEDDLLTSVGNNVETINDSSCGNLVFESDVFKVNLFICLYFSLD